MSDKDVFVSLLAKIPDTSWEELTKSDPEFADAELADKSTEIRITVWPGYRAHFEAEFDAAGNILNIGQWDDL